MPEEPNLNTPSPTENTTTGANNRAFMTEVQNRLLGQADVVSSLDTEIESSFDKAISGIETSRDANTQRIESQFGRELGYAQDNAQAQFTDFSENRSGFGTQMVAFRRLVETTDKELKDLEQRKQELILQGESNAASQLAQLQVQQLQFRQQAEQQVFGNLLNVGNFSLQTQAADRAERQFGLQLEQFGLSQAQFALEESTAAFTRISQLKEMGALSGIPEDQRLELENNAGLPAGTVESIANVPPQSEIRAVGNNLIAINPDTLETEIIYSGGGSDSGGDVSIGGTGVSWMTSSVLNGMQSLDSLSPTNRAQVLSEMSKLGFGNEETPQWFKDKFKAPVLNYGNRDDRGQGIGTPTLDSLLNEGPINEAAAKAEWMKYQEAFVYGPRFLDRSYFNTRYTTAQIEKDAENFGFNDTASYLDSLETQVNQLRRQGFGDKEIVELMNL